jgi:hypothetical protein
MSSSTQTARQTTAYHWVMSVQTSDGRSNTRSAIVDVPDGVTRQQVFEFVYKQFADEYGTTLVVLFFDLQPNRL